MNGNFNCQKVVGRVHLENYNLLVKTTNETIMILNTSSRIKKITGVKLQVQTKTLLSDTLYPKTALTRQLHEMTDFKQRLVQDALQ